MRLTIRTSLRAVNLLPRYGFYRGFQRSSKMYTAKEELSSNLKLANSIVQVIPCSQVAYTCDHTPFTYIRSLLILLIGQGFTEAGRTRFSVSHDLFDCMDLVSHICSIDTENYTMIHRASSGQDQCMLHDSILHFTTT